VSAFLGFQTYPPPTSLPPMRAGETDGRYMDCSPALAPVDDSFINILDVTITVTRADTTPMTDTDLQPDPVVGPSLDPTGMIATFWWIAPVGNTGADYILTLTCNQTVGGRLFVRDWSMSIVPLLG
jgi:hypothetical protein